MRRLQWLVVRAVIDLDVELAHAVDLENAFRRPSGKHGHAVRAGIPGQVRAVERPLNGGKPEVRDQAVRHSCLKKRGHCWIGGLRLRAVEELEAPQLQIRVAESFEVDEGL